MLYTVYYQEKNITIFIYSLINIPYLFYKHINITIYYKYIILHIFMRIIIS